jgi:hypothetical protein
MEIKKENLLKALNTGSDSVKETILAIFPELKEEAAQKADKRPVTERIKTFEDACKELGENHPLVLQYEFNYNAESGWSDNADTSDFAAYLKLRIICAALNEGWEPKFTEDEWRFYPWFYLYTQQELDDMDENDKQECHMIDTGDYETEYCGFGCAYSDYVPSRTAATFGSLLCLKNSELATYCGKQFISLWADFNLIRRR